MNLQILKYSTLHLPGSIPIHASPSYRRTERSDDALIRVEQLRGQREQVLPWIRIHKMFQTEDGRQWILASKAEYADSAKPLSESVGAPLVRFLFDSKLILPITVVWQRVITVQDENEPTNYTICWWINSGQLCYPEDHRYDIILNV